MSSDFVTNEEIVQEARRKLSQGPWDYLVGASESETTMRRNRLAFDTVAFRPRVFVDVSSVDTSTSITGIPMKLPVMLAPIGSLQVFHPEGGAAVTSAAGKFETLHVVSSVTQPSLEDIAGTTDYPKAFQLYIHGDWEWTKDMLDRIKASGYKAICITVDTASYSNRERPLLSRWVPMSQRNPPDPVWQASVTWETIERIREYVDLPLMIKGIGTGEDAAISIEHGVDVVWVSNHGGRQLDHGLGTMDILPEVVDAVDGKAEIVLDGGVQRGSDVLKALCLGAKAVAIGKLQGWGLSANGSDGVYRVLEVLQQEIQIAMRLMGVTSVSELGPNRVTRAEATTEPHEMSSWVNMPISRIK